ncbi:recombinase family protein [Clostridium butyricum]|uniref:Resolvase n=1 Tax=Clostridium butyricum E4 str. BoNT E BL5262 TaxID=632245 RepID=C4ILG4_CLOBU|nr:site-specific recombinase [Clostridium butyricum 5521]EEP53698.1 resolvase [Clostridium butyricum E4 str. BoNT E BL5262]NFL32998.1 recombinase family protein [Clostridium butyricum]NFS17967.1 recombinase family protein [Clostridium butyricum]
MIKVAIYSRKSRETETGDSIENQIILCKEYCNRNYLGEEIEYIIYEDEGFSGKNTDRPRFQQLMKDIKSKKINMLICYRLDRISRSVADFSSTLEFLQLNNCDFISIKEQFDTSTPMGRAMIYIASVFAQLERETIAERVRDNMLQMAKKGQWLGGNTPFGFESKRIKYLDESLKERTMCTISPVNSDLDIIKRIYNIYIETESTTKTAKRLHTEGVTKNNTIMQSITITRILRSAIYVKSSEKTHEYLRKKSDNIYGEANGNGYLTYAKTTNTLKRSRNNEDKWIYAVSKHKGVIDDDTWLKVQRILDRNKNKDFKRTGTGNNPALLSGIFKCKKCGSNMIVRRTGEYYYYICSSKVHKIGSSCNCKNVRVDQLDNNVISQLKNYSNSLLIEELSNSVAKFESIESNSSNSDNLKKELNSKVDMVNNLIKRISLAPSDDIAEMIMNQISDINKEIKSLKSKLDNIDNIKIKDNIDKQNVLLFIDSLKNFSKNIELFEDPIKRRSLIQTVVKKIIWNDDEYVAEIELLEEVSDEYKKK